MEGRGDDEEGLAVFEVPMLWVFMSSSSFPAMLRLLMSGLIYEERVIKAPLFRVK